MYQYQYINEMTTDTNYYYYDANRLTAVDSIAYTWDDNGNLLDDGVNEYTYDSANRLIEVSDQLSVSSYTYNGFGDRLTQTVDSNTTNYTLDLASGLTQVLYDGENFYTYGIGRISQLKLYGNTPEYFITDALGSVRQLTHESSAVLMTQSYDPYGSVVSSAGSVDSIYGYTGEQTDVTGNVYLRARYYNPLDGRFLSRDTWSGDVNNPLSLNRWNYVEGNPINFVDPTGHCKRADGSIDFWGWPWGSRFKCWFEDTSQSSASQTSPSVTPESTPSPTCTPTVIPTPSPTSTPTTIYLGKWKITHYHIALESDPQFPANDKVPVSGLDQSKTYRRQFIYSFPGIYGQGTGKAEDGTYITIDHTRNQQEYGSNWINTDPSSWFFTYGKGGRNKEPIAWKTVAMNQSQTGLTWNDKVKIDGYEHTFEVTDTGTFPDTEHLDVFVGEVFHAEALQYGTVYRDVWKVLK